MERTLILLPVPAEERFSLADTLDCGQCFRWTLAEDGWWEGVAGRRVCRVFQDTSGLLVDDRSGLGGEEAFWRRYFDLDTSYASIRESLCKNPTLAKAAAYAPGIRVLRQAPWEALCSFILSQNNNVKRIQGIVDRLCASFGDPLGGGFFSFPGPERLAPLSTEDLAPLRCGFRAAYVLDAARKVSSGEVDLEATRLMPLEEARAALQQIHGVGPKVAECALLYGQARMDCFPLDVWMKRVMERLFPRGLPRCARDCAGIAQQYLFHYARTCPEAFPEKETKS